MPVAMERIDPRRRIAELRAVKFNFQTIFGAMLSEGYPPETFIFWLGEYLTIS